jgi:SAM-dependent methyltransferase
MDEKIDPARVRADFNEIATVVHYTRAAHFLGLWESERLLVERFFPDRTARLLEAGCGAGRVAVGLWHLGYRDLTGFDFAEELVAQAASLAREQGIAAGLRFLHADATRLHEHAAFAVPAAHPRDLTLNKCQAPAPGAEACHLLSVKFDGVLFLFNGLMQIPGREHRRAALRELHAVCRPGARFIFTTHDRDDGPAERAVWAEEADRWARGEQDPRLVEFGDRYFAHETGRTFMHLPDRAEILADLAATGWGPEFDAMRREIADERRAVREFSDECRFWVARKS